MMHRHGTHSALGTRNLAAGHLRVYLWFCVLYIIPQP